MDTGRYNTYVIDTDNFRAIKVVASGVNSEEAWRTEQAVSRRYSGIDHFVQSYPDGSERDVECKKDLKKLAKVR